MFTDDELAEISSPVDFVGINVYRPSSYVLPSDEPPGYREIPVNASHPKMASSWHLFGPECLYWAPRQVRDLWGATSIYITENGCAALDVVAMSTGSAVLKAVAGALVGGGLVTVSLLQETTSHYPMPLRRAAAWGAAALAGILALELGVLFAGDTDRLGLLEAAILLAVAATAALVTLGVTQTNRTKGWVRDVATGAPDQFTQDPATAARFGLYTGVLWLAAFGGMVAVGLTAGWLWSWVPLLAALLVEMLLLARMLFPAGHR